MISHPSYQPVSRLRARMMEDMSVRGFTEKTRYDYIRCVKTFAAFIGRAPDTATAEDLRRFQLHETQAGMQPPGINRAVSALRFFFTVTRSTGPISPAVSPLSRSRASCRWC